MGKIITIAAIKGGTGKTTTAAALSQAAVKDGLRVLAIDIDPQASLSLWLKADFDKPNSYDFITGRTDPEKAIQETEMGIDLIAGHGNLIALETKSGSAYRLEAALKNIRRKYDLIFIDTSPAMGEGQNNALSASNGLIIPLSLDIASLQGFYNIMHIARKVKAAKPGFKILGIVVTQYDGRCCFNRYMIKTLKEKAEEAKIPYLMEIRRSIAVTEAAAMCKNIFEYAKKANATQDYKALYKKIMKEC